MNFSFRPDWLICWYPFFVPLGGKKAAARNVGLPVYLYDFRVFLVERTANLISAAIFFL